MLSWIIDTAILLVSAPLLIMSVVLFIEVLAGSSGAPVSLPTKPAPHRQAAAILVPAHNESAVIGQTLSLLSSQLRANDRLLIVADNCTDDTAEIARKHGAEVIERTSAVEVGKGYALAFGVKYLAENPRPVTIIIDADCAIAPSTIDILCCSVAETRRPVQARNLIEVSASAPLGQRISAFAFRVKNLVRYEGLRRMGLPCLLAGTGMAFPWCVLKDAKLASGNIVEDMKLGIDLAIAGSPASFEPNASITSHFPESSQDQQAQRRRWEHGHVQTIVREVPRLVWQAVRQGRKDLLALAADLLILPLSLHALLTASYLVLSTIAIIFDGSILPFTTCLTAVMLLGLSIWISWQAQGRDLISHSELVKLPFYMMKKIPIYFGLLYRREQKWKRATRPNERTNED